MVLMHAWKTSLNLQERDKPFQLTRPTRKEATQNKLYCKLVNVRGRAIGGKKKSVCSSLVALISLSSLLHQIGPDLAGYNWTGKSHTSTAKLNHNQPHRMKPPYILQNHGSVSAIFFLSEFSDDLVKPGANTYGCFLT